jgi:hypothetical protein
VKAAGQGRRKGRHRRTRHTCTKLDRQVSKPWAGAAPALLEGEGDEEEGRKKAQWWLTVTRTARDEEEIKRDEEGEDKGVGRLHKARRHLQRLR